MTEILEKFGGKFFGKFKSIPLEWYTPPEPTYSKKLLRPSSDPRSIPTLAQKSYLITLAAGLIIFQGIHQTKSAQGKNASSEGNTLTWLTVILLIATNCHLHIFRMKAAEIAAFINGLIQFDRIYQKKLKRFIERPVSEKLIIFSTFAITITAPLFPSLFVIGLHWQNPWKASLAGYWLIPQPNEPHKMFLKDEAVTIAAKLLVFSFNYWMWGLLAGAAKFAGGMIHSLCITTLLDNIQEFGALCTSRSCRRQISAYRRGMVFRHIQLLVEVLNEFQESLLIPVLLNAIIVVYAFALNMLVKSSMLTTTYLMLMLWMDATLAIMVVLGGMAIVHKRAKEILLNRKSNRDELVPVKEQKWEQRFYNSCRPLKIKIGYNNFVDEFTPLKCLYFAMSLSANVMLLGGNRS